WKAIGRMSSALAHLSEFNQRCAEAVDEALNTAVPDHWSSDSAEAASAYFHRFKEALEDQAMALRQMSAKVADIANVAVETGALAKGLLQDLTNELLAIVADAVAGEITSETGIGLLLSAGIALALAQRALKKWIELKECIEKAYK